MEPLLILTGALCVLVGISMGLLGAGGSVLMIPLFVYVARMPVGGAIALSLLIAVFASAAGLVRYSKRGEINKRLVVLFVIPGGVSSFFGARAARLFSPEHLMLFFGIIMLVISVILYNKSRTAPRAEGPLVCRPNLFLSVGVGGVTGFLTGFLGVGGGFLIVPAIALLMKCSFHTAVGTSLAVIALNSAAGFAGHLSDFRPDIYVNAGFVTATMGGAVAGTALSGKFSDSMIQKIFAALIFAVGTFVTVRHAF